MRYISVAAALAAVCFGATVPAGTELHLRLKTPVSSNASKAGEKVEAVLITPAFVDGKIVVPAGVSLRGSILAAKPVVTSDERGILHLGFTHIGEPPVPISARVVHVDNSRETVSEAGEIVGILASETLAARIDQGIGKVAQRNPGLADLLDAAKASVFKEGATGEIRYDAGVELSIRLTQPLEWKGPAEGQPLAPIKDRSSLYELVNAQPFQTLAENPPKPSDITNLMFVGTKEELERAFKEAGWTTAQSLNTESILETVRAIGEMRGYKEAPMSVLLLDGKRSDYDYQKQNNTFAKRHHLRIWRRPGTFEGKPVWVSSATHDTGIEFSPENRTFIHTIDPEIDRERAKVVSDFLFTGRVKSVALVERPEVPRKTENATGDDILTDGRMAVLILK